MKTKKKMIVIPVLAALLLTACNTNAADAETTQSNTERAEPTSAQTEHVTDTVTTEENVDVADETFLIGLDKKGVGLSDIKKLTLQDGTEISGENLTLDSFNKDNFSTAECEGFCYLAEPLNIGETGTDNDENFASMDTMGSIGTDTNRVFKRYNVGDKYGDLTVKKATVIFDATPYNEPSFGWEPIVAGKDIDFPEVFYKNQYIEFEGEATMTGYITVNESSDYFPELGGTMEFVADSESNPLPIAYAEMSLDSEGGFYTTRYRMTLGNYGENEEYFINEYGSIILGNIKNTSADTAGLDAEYPKFQKVKVTIDNIKMPLNTNLPFNLSYIQGELTKLEILS